MESSLCSFELSFFTDEDRSIESKNLEIQRHLFRVVQELINNAKKHSRAQHVTVSCTSSDNTFYLEYQDDGIGLDLEDTATVRTKSSGTGIEQMKSRIMEIGGTFHMKSSQGHGLQVEIAIRISEEGLVA
jgi:two-component system sensor histidine kinase ComP